MSCRNGNGADRVRSCNSYKESESEVTVVECFVRDNGAKIARYGFEPAVSCSTNGFVGAEDA